MTSTAAFPSPRSFRGMPFLVLLLCLLAWLPLLAQADNLTELKDGLLPSPEGGAVQALETLQGQPVAKTADGRYWRLAPGTEAWRALQAPAGLELAGAATLGRSAYVLDTQEGQASTLLRVTLEGDAVAVAPVLALPQPLTSARVAASGDALEVVGLAADGSPQRQRLQPDTVAPAWSAQPVWSGPGTPVALLAQTRALYLVLAAPEATRLLRWSADDGWQEKPAVPGQPIPGGVRATGQAHLLFLLAQPDGGRRLLSYHTITSAWADLPVPARIDGAGVATGYGNGLVWTGLDGDLATTRLQAGKHLLGWIDWTVIIVYLAAMIGIGAFFYIREKRGSTADFFVGGRSIPFWAAGISLYATNTSSISFIAIPAKAFETNWQYLTNNLVAVMGLMFVAVWVVPLLRRLDLMSVFSYLETRFHPAIRMLASALCIVMQVGSRMSVILFLPALAIATITGIDVVLSILLMGVFTIVYTAMGGMKAVIWTDFVQVFVKMGGALFAIGYIVYSLDGGVAEFLTTAAAEDKTKLLDFSFDLTKATVWGFIFLVVFDVVLTFPKDQVLMQRALSTKSDKDAGRSIWAFAAIMIPGGFIFYSIGTALFVYYKSHPERLNPVLPIDATFPLFIAAELPPGVTGLIIAGIFAAAMSTLSSIMNSVATLISVDFYEKLAKKPSQKRSVLFAEVTTVLVGIAGMALALVMSRYDIHSLFDVSIELAGLLGGGFAGAYTLGMFTRRANSKGVAIGVAGSIVLTFIAWTMDLVHPYFYLAISIFLCIVIGYVASLLFPPPERSLEGLTIYNRDKPAAPAAGEGSAG